MFDLHLHSTASDGDLAPGEVIRESWRRGLSGASLCDHNGLWGIDEARAEAQKLGLTFWEGIEVTATFRNADVHILGYSHAFDRGLLERVLAATRAGYEERIREMVELCHTTGYTRVSWPDIAARRSRFTNPCHVSFDVARELAEKYGLDLETARKMTVGGGVCHVPYGDWALDPVSAIKSIHQAGGVASLAHPGTIEREGSRELLLQLLRELTAAGLEAIETVHPFHDESYQHYLMGLAHEFALRITGGSDWHGPDHLPMNDAAFGKVGVSAFPLL